MASDADLEAKVKQWLDWDKVSYEYDRMHYAMLCESLCHIQFNRIMQVLEVTCFLS